MKIQVNPFLRRRFNESLYFKLKLVSIVFSVVLYACSVNAYGQCSTGDAAFSWDGEGSRNELVWPPGQTVGSSVITACSKGAMITVNVENPHNVYYLGPGSDGNATNGFFDSNGFSIWLDEDDDLFNTVPIDSRDQASFVIF